MKQTPKERLNDKARKMIDLIYDEVFEGGEKEISSSFFDPKTNLKSILSVKITVTSPEDEIEIDDVLSQFIEEESN